MTKPRIYRARDGCGILFAGEDPNGIGFIMYHSTVTRKKRKAHAQYHGDRRFESWEKAQEDLDRIAESMELNELPLTIGGEL